MNSITITQCTHGTASFLALFVVQLLFNQSATKAVWKLQIFKWNTLKLGLNYIPVQAQR